MDSPVAIVTGGTGGVGSHVCRLLVGEGYRVVFTFRSNIAARDALLVEFGDRACAVACDFSLPRDVDALFDAADDIGPVRSVVHAGGPVVPQEYLSLLTDEDFERHLQLEVMPVFSLIRAALPRLREEGGSFVAVTTVANRRFPVMDVLSSAPKASVEALVRALAKEEGRYGVRANAVGPGILEDGMAADLHANGHFDAEVQQKVIAGIPLRRFGTAREVAELVAFLATARAGYITGQVIDVDGGYQL